MIVCTKCGHQNTETDSFCGSCGSFLEWTGQRFEAPSPAPEPEAPAAPAEPERAGLVDRAKRALGLDEEAAAATASSAPGAPPAEVSESGGAAAETAAAEPAAPAAPAPAAPAPVVVRRPKVARAAPPIAADAATAEAAAPPTLPAAEPSATPVQPAPVRPSAAQPAAVKPPPAAQPAAVKPAAARVKVAPRSVPVAEPVPSPGDLICSSCAAGNDPARRFCRRCGTSLAASTVAPRRVPWWRRIFGRSRKPLAAGERPRTMHRDASAATGPGVGGSVRSLVSLAIIALIAGAATGYMVLPSVRSAVNGGIDEVRRAVAPSYIVVNTAGQASGAGIAGHPAQAAFDGFNNTYWAAPGGQKLPTISAHFSPAADIAKVLITSGASDDFQAQPRPRTIKLDFLDATGASVGTKEADLQDIKDPQTFDVDARGATSVRITVETIYPSIKGASVSITEVEFRSRH